MKGRRGRVFLVLDGHPAHKAKVVQSYVASLGGRLEFHRLPTYAPDLNPDEFVWSHMKTASSRMFWGFFIERDKGPIHRGGKRCPF